MIPQVGQRIGPYEILGRLGSGGMGLVFSAWDGRLHRDVAIKILREEYATPDMRSRFLQEARAASGLNHPNICTIFDIGELEGDPYLVMELLKGETLRQRINAGGMTMRELVRIGYDIADALSAAHSRGVIHRDIKPANVFLVNKPGGGRGTKVLDFGLAKVDAYGADLGFDLTHTGTTVGTVSYMSPEQARGEALDARSDLFSLGVMLYEMACGRLPFVGATSALIFVELLSKAPDGLRDQCPAISEELEAVILRLLEKDRNLRFQSGQQLMEALEAIPSSTAAPRWQGKEEIAAVLPRPVEEPGTERVRASTAAISRAEIRSAADGPMAEPTPNAGVAESPARRAESSAVQPAAREGNRSAISADEVLRPKHRVPPSESSAMIRAVPKDFPAKQDVTPAAADSAANDAKGASSAVHRTHGSSDAMIAGPKSRPIVRQSARTADELKRPPIALPRMHTPLPAPRFSRIEDVNDLTESPQPLPAAATVDSAPNTEGGSYRWVWGVGFVVTVVVVGALLFWKMRPAPASERIVPLVIGPVTNGTADLVLQRAVVHRYANGGARGFAVSVGLPLPRRAFQPPPRVDSAVLVIRRG